MNNPVRPRFWPLGRRSLSHQAKLSAYSGVLMATYRTFCWLAGLFILGLVLAGCDDMANDSSSEDNDVPHVQGPGAVDIEMRCTDWAEWENHGLLYQNNIWGKGDIADYEQCLLRRNLDGNDQYGWRWQWPGGTGDVKAYPEVIYGHKPWHSSSTTSNLPQRIASVNKLSITYAVELTAQGTYNLAFDIWVTSDNPPTPETITHEIMIWMDQTFPAQPPEFRVGQVTLDDFTYDLYIRPNFDPEPGTDHGLAEEKPGYIAFVSQADQYQGMVNVEKFLGYLVEHEHIPADSYVASVEFGNEVIGGSGELWLNRYQIEVE